jgi:hypothetical protein
MADVGILELTKFWLNRFESLMLEHENIIQLYPDAKATVDHIRELLNYISCQVECTPASVGESPKWTRIGQTMEHREDTQPDSKRKADVHSSA